MVCCCRGGNVEDDTLTGDGIVFDGIVPNITINYEDDQYLAQYYGGYYATARERNGILANDFLHTWANAGYKWSKYVSTGVHWELLENTRSTSGSPSTVYHWIGGFIGFTFGDGLFARFTAGADIEDDSPGNFYKMTVGYSF